MSRYSKELNREEFRGKIQDIINECNEVREITPYQFRINEQLDIYPSSRKFCDVGEQKWGDIEEDYVMFIVRFFKKKWAKEKQLMK